MDGRGDVRVPVELVGVVVAHVRVVGGQRGRGLLGRDDRQRAGVGVGVGGVGPHRGRLGPLARRRTSAVDLLVHSTRVRAGRPDR